jgi:hypothetical protein
MSADFCISCAKPMIIDIVCIAVHALIENFIIVMHVDIVMTIFAGATM